MGRVIKFKDSALPLRKGSKGGNRCLSIGLAPETAERVDNLVTGERLRSAWVERAAQFMVSVQEGDGEKMKEWMAWCKSAMAGEDFVMFKIRLLDMIEGE